MASAINKNNQIHSKLIVDLANMLPQDSEDLDALKKHALTTKKVTVATMSRLRKPIDFFNEWEKRGIIGVGQYEFLLEHLSTHKDAVDCIEDALRRMRQTVSGEVNASGSQQNGRGMTHDSGVMGQGGLQYGQQTLHSLPPKKTGKDIDLPAMTSGQFLTDLPDEYVYFKGDDPVNGYILIVNNFTEERTGTNEDVKKIKGFFQDVLGYEVYEAKDKCRDDLEHILRKVKENIQEGFTSCNLLFVFVLSHGDQGGIKTCKTPTEHDERYVSTEELVKYFKSDQIPIMTGKPKLFFVQCCRGGKDQDGMVVADDETSPSSINHQQRGIVEQSPPLLTVPVDADILISMSTTPGYRSYRSPQGSWYITELINVFQEFYQKLPLMTMLTILNNRISAKNASGESISIDVAKQIPSHTTTLRKELFLLKKTR